MSIPGLGERGRRVDGGEIFEKKCCDSRICSCLIAMCKGASTLYVECLRVAKRQALRLPRGCDLALALLVCALIDQSVPICCSSRKLPGWLSWNGRKRRPSCGRSRKKRYSGFLSAASFSPWPGEVFFMELQLPCCSDPPSLFCSVFVVFFCRTRRDLSLLPDNQSRSLPVVQHKLRSTSHHYTNHFDSMPITLAGQSRCAAHAALNIDGISWWPPRRRRKSS